MSKPYLLLSDIHFHEWSQFATRTPEGINSRLALQVSEVERAADELEALGGNRIVIAGDTYHVRGSISPTVMNPVLDLFDRLSKRGFKIDAIPGNHDLASKESDALSNAAQALTKVGVTMHNEPTLLEDLKIVMVPWCSSVAALKEIIDDTCDGSTTDRHDLDLILHAPVNGVLFGIPDHGLDAAWLSEVGFKRVFSGHYHNAVEFPGGVFSIGASCHQTWSDIGTRAGFLLVDEDKVTYRASRAPKFVEITSDTPEDDIPLIVDGNYVRAKVSEATEPEIKALREHIMEMGAAGVVIHSIKSPKLMRSGYTAKIGSSIEASLGAYIKSEFPGQEKELFEMCSDILSRVRAEA